MDITNWAYSVFIEGNEVQQALMNKLYKFCKENNITCVKQGNKIWFETNEIRIDAISKTFNIKLSHGYHESI